MALVGTCGTVVSLVIYVRLVFVDLGPKAGPRHACNNIIFMLNICHLIKSWWVGLARERPKSYQGHKWAPVRNPNLCL